MVLMEYRTLIFQTILSSSIDLMDIYGVATDNYNIHIVRSFLLLHW